MYIVAIFLMLVIFALAFVIWDQKKKIEHTGRVASNVIAKLRDDLNLAHNQYDALEQGMAEQEENYEMQFLTFGETIERLEKENTDLKAVTEFHEGFCLPNLPLVK